MKRYSFCIKTDLDLQKIALATLKRVHSYTVVPRVLINSHIDEFIKWTNGTIFLCQIDLPQQSFKKSVHNKNYDLGLYFYKKGSEIFADVIDGTGSFACTHTQNIFLDMFLKNEEEVKIASKNLKKLCKTPKMTKKLADLSY
ncbi:MAG: hypothetical protein ACI4TZ_00165 [Christensenellales bacterium]